MRHFIFENSIGGIIIVYAKTQKDAFIILSTEFNKIHKLSFLREII